MNKIKISFIIIAIFSLSTLLQSCKPNTDKNEKTEIKTGQKIGVLLASHGSRSETWRNSLLEIENSARDSILKDNRVEGIATAFMEYTGPSIAARLKEFDKKGFKVELFRLKQRPLTKPFLFVLLVFDCLHCP